MVSFFGLKFGGDKRKGQTKQNDKKQPQQWNRVDQNTLGEGEFFGRTESARPETSYSMRSPTNWRATFKGLGANSSMVDLTAPPARKQSISSLRNWGNSSSAHLPLPPTLGAPGMRVGLPERPSTASSRTREWVNPLDVHFCKDTSGSTFSIDQDGLGSVSSQPDDTVKQTSAEEDRSNHNNTSTTTTTAAAAEKDKALISNGYPSPPASNNGDQTTLTPSASESSTLGIRSPSSAFPASLPSPAASAPRSSDDRWDTPVVRNVLARRDTVTFNAPRRRSLTMDFTVNPEELEKIRKQQKTEGFAGNFAAFDFGESVKRQTTIDLVAPHQLQSDEEIQTPKLPDMDQPSTPLQNQKSEAIVDVSNTLSPITKVSSQTEHPILESINSFEFPMPGGMERRTEPTQRPVTSYGPGQRNISAPFDLTGSSQPSNAALDLATPVFSLRPRLGSNASTSSKTSSLRPARPPVQIAPKGEESRSKSPFSPVPDASGYSVSVESSKPRSKSISKPMLEKTPTTSPYKKPRESFFPSSKSLPRGRQPPRRPPRSDEAKDMSPGQPEFSIPNWGGFDRAEPRRSAIPAPLSSLRAHKDSVSSPTSAVAPQLPSPSFASLELSISDSSESLTAAFEQALENSSLAPGLAGDFFSVDTTMADKTLAGAVTRVEAKKAPPRPAPITLPPSPDKMSNSALQSPRSATASEFRSTFI